MFSWTFQLGFACYLFKRFVCECVCVCVCVCARARVRASVLHFWKLTEQKLQFSAL